MTVYFEREINPNVNLYLNLPVEICGCARYTSKINQKLNAHQILLLCIINEQTICQLVNANAAVRKFQFGFIFAKTFNEDENYHKTRWTQNQHNFSTTIEITKKGKHHRSIKKIVSQLEKLCFSRCFS